MKPTANWGTAERDEELSVSLSESQHNRKKVPLAPTSRSLILGTCRLH